MSDINHYRGVLVPDHVTDLWYRGVDDALDTRDVRLEIEHTLYKRAIVTSVDSTWSDGIEVGEEVLVVDIDKLPPLYFVVDEATGNRGWVHDVSLLSNEE